MSQFLIITSSIIAAVLVAIAGFPATTVAQDATPVQLRWKFTADDQFEIVIEQRSSTHTQVDRRQLDQSNNMKLSVAWHVESVDHDGTAKIRQTITSIRAEITLPDAKGPVTTVYDSTVERHRGAARRLENSFSKILNQPVFLTMTARGEITAVDIPDDTKESIRQMPGSMEGRNAFSIESVREMFQSAGTEFPDAAIGIGQSWNASRQFRIGSPHLFTRETTYTLGKSGKIDFQSILSIDSSVETAEDPDLEFFPWNIQEQQSGGTITFDLDRGNVSDSKSNTNLQTVTAYESFAVTTTLESTVSMTVARKQ